MSTREPMGSMLRVAGLLAAGLTWSPVQAGDAAPSGPEKAGAEGRALLDDVLNRQRKERAGTEPQPGRATPETKRKVEDAEASDRRTGRRLTEEVPSICIGCGGDGR